MRLPEGVGDELELLDELEEFQEQVKGGSRLNGAAAAASGGGSSSSSNSSSSGAWGAGWSSKVAKGRGEAAGRVQQQGSGMRGGKVLGDVLKERFGADGNDEGTLLGEGMSLYSQEEFKREFEAERDK
jgi:hypothetical protein